MKQQFLFTAVLFFLGTQTIFSQDAKSIHTEITDVTVFLDGAQIHREAGISLKPGENLLKIVGLEEMLDASSFQVEGNDDYLIKEVKYNLNYLEDSEVLPGIKAKQDSLKELRFILETRSSLERVYNEEKAMVLANRSVKGNDAVLLAEDIEEVADFFRNRLKEIEYKLLDLREEKKELNENISRLENHLWSLSANKNKLSSELFVTLIANRSVNTTIAFNYFVNEAQWTPLYDIRAVDVDNPVELIYKAQVSQNTGIAWEGVKLTLSTGNPTVGGRVPELHAWWLQWRNEWQKAYVLANKSRARVSAVEEAYDAESTEDYAFEELDVSGNYSDYTQMANNLIQTEFSLAIPHDVPSDNHAHEVELQRISLQSEFEYFAIPKLDKDAFLIANVVDWQKHKLLPGASNVFFAGTFVGKSSIDPAVINDTLVLSLGRDKGVVINRELISDFCKTSTFAGKKKTEKGYRITVNNTKSTAVNITIEDQLPLSTQGDMEVEIIEISGARYDEESGKLIWELELAPHDNQEIVIKFSVKYPKKRVIANL